MAKHLYLPALIKESNVEEPARSGHWNAAEKRPMAAISDGIEVDENAKSRGVSSVPDVWARPLTFQGALRRESRHPLRDQIVQEWRGMLSLIALSKLHNYKLEIVPVSLDDRAFSKALRNLAPKPLELEEGQAYSWTDVFILKYDGVAVGALSPATLVYTATSYQKELQARNVSNVVDTDGNLRPPVDREDLMYVAEWVSQFRKRLNSREAPILDNNANEPAERNAINMINALLADWLADLCRELGVREDDLDVPNVVVAAEPLQSIHRHRVYHELLRPLQRKGLERPDRLSEIALRLRPERNFSGYDHLVVITPALLRSNAKIWSSTRLGSLGGDVDSAMTRYFNAEWGRKIEREDLGDHKAIWIRPERWFLTETLLTAPGRAEILATTERDGNVDVQYVYPFKKSILDVFSAREIVDLLKPEFRRTDTGVVFSFVLPVGEGTQTERVEKLYRFKNAAQGEGSVREISPPVVEVFPNYVDQYWRRYYLFQADLEAATVTPVIYGNNKTAARERDGQVRLTEISGDNAFPEGLLFSEPGAANRPMGIALIPRPKEPDAISRTWRIGIDFGTSNTNVFLQDEDSERAEQWVLDFGRHLRRITMTSDELRSAKLEAYFVPAKIVKLPTATHLRIFNPAEKQHMLLDYFMYLSSYYRLPANVYADIKWDSESDRKTEYFLECLLFTLLLEAASRRIARVELVCSYPKAFSMSMIGIFKSDWDRVFKKLLDSPTLENGLPAYRQEDRILNRRPPRAGAMTERMQIEEPVYGIEGIAAGHYFQNPKTIASITDRLQPGNLEICIDVGGGTTDISIWFEDRILADASVLLAGRQISTFLRLSSGARQLLFTEEAAIALEEKQQQPGPFAARLNVVLKEQEEQIRDALGRHANRKEIQWLRRMLAIEFGAIAWYTSAMVANVLRNDSHAELAQRIQESGIGVHWGGNAAKFLSWIDFGRYSEEETASKILKALLFNALKTEKLSVRSEKIGQKQSPGHKAEVAGGLVVMDYNLVTVSPTTLSGNATYAPSYDAGGALEKADDLDFHESKKRDDSGTICGETIELISGERIEYYSAITKNALFDRNVSRLRRTTLTRLEEFVEITNHFGVRFGLFNEDTRIQLRDREKTLVSDNVRGAFITAAKQEEAKRVIEPVFISEVKVLLDLMAQPS